MTKTIVPKELLAATPGGLSLLVVSGGADGQVLTQQADGTYAPEAVSAGIGGSVGSTDNRLVRSDGTGGNTVQSTGITVDDSNNVSGVVSLDVSGALRVAQTGAIAVRSTFSTDRVSIGAFGAIGYGSSNYVFSTRAVSGGGGYFLNNSSDASYAAFRGDGTSAAVIAADAGLSIRNLAMAADAQLSAGAITASGLMCAGTYTVATLPSASANTGKFAQVTDSSVTTFRGTVAGGGSTRVPVFSDGTNWVVA